MPPRQSVSESRISGGEGYQTVRRNRLPGKEWNIFWTSDMGTLPSVNHSGIVMLLQRPWKYRGKLLGSKKECHHPFWIGPIRRP